MHRAFARQQRARKPYWLEPPPIQWAVPPATPKTPAISWAAPLAMPRTPASRPGTGRSATPGSRPGTRGSDKAPLQGWEGLFHEPRSAKSVSFAKTAAEDTPKRKSRPRSVRFSLDTPEAVVRPGGASPALFDAALALSVVSALFLHCVHKRNDKAFHRGTPLPGHRYVAPASYAAFSAIFGAQSVVQAKCLAILILYYVDRSEPGGLQGFGDMFLNYWTYVTLFAWVFFVAVWLYRMNEALGLYDPIFIIPLLQAGFIIFAIISGGIYFGEFSRFQPGHWLFFCFGIFFVCIGLPLLSPKDASDKKPSDIRRIQPLSSVPEEGGEPKTPTLDLAALEESTRSRRSPSLDGSPKPRSSFGDRPSSRPSSGSSSGRFDLTGSGMSRRLLSHVAVTSVASSHNFGSPRAVTAKGSSRRSLDPEARRSLDGDLQRAEDGERKDPSMATI